MVRNNLTTAEQKSHCNDKQARCSSRHPPLRFSNPSKPNAEKTILAAIGAFYINNQTRHSDCTSLFIIRVRLLQRDSFSLQQVLSISKARKPNLLMAASSNLAVTSFSDFQKTLGFRQYKQHIMNIILLLT